MVTDRTDQELANVPDQFTNGRTSLNRLRAESAHVGHSSRSAERLPRWGMSSPVPLRRHGGGGLTRENAELAQRGRLILDVSSAGLETAEAALGAFHPTTWQLRNLLGEARRSWERLRAALGTKILEAALSQPPLTTLTLDENSNGSPCVVLVLIEGKTYRAQQVPGTELAPIQWRLTRLHPPLENGPYYVCRLANRSTQCDCAEWTYRIAETSAARGTYCKHLAALISLGWL
jgi:SWIM zinc finger